MAKKLFKAKFNDNLPLGGITSGHISFTKDGSIISDSLCAFAIKAEKDGELIGANLLQSSPSALIPLPFFEKSESNSFFPFAEVSLSDSSFPANVKITAFSPFIPLNDTDSGIPAVLFEFEVTNNNESRIDFSICNLAQNRNSDSYNRMGCTDTGEAYILFSGTGENPDNTCTATNSKNISFCEYISSFDDFCNNFLRNATLINEIFPGGQSENAYGALCTHFSLGANETKKISFCISWYNSENEFSRNYYAQYFESSLECASYLFRQSERLYTSSMDFCENVLGATLPESTLEEINNDLFMSVKKGYIRLGDGTLVADTEVFGGFDSFINRQGILSSLFPKLEYTKTEQFYKSALYETASDNETALSVLKSYRKYILTSDTDALIEEWYYIVKCMEKLFGEDGKAKNNVDSSSVSALIEAAFVMAEAVKDKKRAELYSQMLENTAVMQFSMDIAEGFSKIGEISGFEYSAKEMHIGFSPKSDLCPLDEGGTFRCFFCTPQGFGYVEEGIDYIEINLLHGSLDIRSFSVPRTPRLVQYGGRNWKFECRNLTAVLDSALEITPQKKLTIFIDIKQ